LPPNLAGAFDIIYRIKLSKQHHVVVSCHIPFWLLMEFHLIIPRMWRPNWCSIYWL